MSDIFMTLRKTTLGVPLKSGKHMPKQIKPTVRMAKPHVDAARITHLVILIITGLLALTCVGAGIYGIHKGATAKTEFVLFGAKLNTEHVGVALIGIGAVSAVIIFRLVLKNLRDLAGLPPDHELLAGKDQNGS
jgi:hypothetical protein